MAENRKDFNYYIEEILGSVDKIGASPISFNYIIGPATMKKYIINEGATIIFWSDDSKTVSKRDKNDKFDKELGFLFAYFYKFFKGSKASMKRVLDTIDYKKIKTFLFEFYVNDSKKTAEQARSYLKNLVVEKKQ